MTPHPMGTLIAPDADAAPAADMPAAATTDPGTAGPFGDAPLTDDEDAFVRAAFEGEEDFEGDPFGEGAFDEAGFRDDAFRDDAFDGEGGFGDEGSLLGGRLDALRPALFVAKLWVREHQTKALLGAFAAGAFLGSLLRR